MKAHRTSPSVLNSRSRFPIALALACVMLCLPACESIDDGSASPDPSGPIFGSPGPGSGSGSGPGPAFPPPNASYPGRIPASAEIATSGIGRLRTEVPRSGTIWVANTTRNYEVISRAVKRGDVIEVIPQRDRIELNDQPISTTNLESNDQHAIFFRPANWSSGPRPYASIPREAQNAASGFGEVSWRAEAAGTIWVGDDRSKKLILSSPVRADDLIEIDASEDRVKLNGRVIYRQNLESKHGHSIFFIRQ